MIWPASFYTLESLLEVHRRLIGIISCCAKCLLIIAIKRPHCGGRACGDCVNDNHKVEQPTNMKWMKNKYIGLILGQQQSSIGNVFILFVQTQPNTIQSYHRRTHTLWRRHDISIFNIYVYICIFKCRVAGDTFSNRILSISKLWNKYTLRILHSLEIDKIRFEKVYRV